MSSCYIEWSPTICLRYYRFQLHSNLYVAVYVHVGVEVSGTGEVGGGEGEGEGGGKREKSTPDLKTQKEEIHALLNQKLKKGDVW